MKEKRREGGKMDLFSSSNPFCVGARLLTVFFSLNEYTEEEEEKEGEGEKANKTLSTTGA